MVCLDLLICLRNIYTIVSNKRSFFNFVDCIVVCEALIVAMSKGLYLSRDKFHGSKFTYSTIT